MDLGAVTQQAVPPVLLALVDDAGLFPPTALSMGAALARHRRDVHSGSPMLSHRFLCPVARLGELLGALEVADRVDVGLIAPADAAGVADAVAAAGADPRVTVRSVDIPAPESGELGVALDVAAELPDGVTTWVEVARRPGWLNSIAALPPAAGVGAKLRCGGADAGAFPSPEDVADFIATCVSHGVPFRATAGLHAAARGVDPDDGLVHHGFLNLLVATAHAWGGAALEETVDALRITDAAALADEVRLLPDAAAAAVRSSFVSYGSCSTAAPVAEATALGLLR